MTKQKLAIIGYGNFGRLLFEILENDFDIFVYDKNTELLKNLQIATEENISQMDYIIFATPAHFLEDSVVQFKKHISEKSIIFDILSVKLFAKNILEKNFPNNEIICTHPLFGPQSYVRDRDNLKVMLDNISASEQSFSKIKNFVKSKNFKIIEMTCDEHDQQMATVQSLSHFIGFGLREFDLEKYTNFSTLTFDFMKDLHDNVLNDSKELFETIQKLNPYAAKIRKDFIEELTNIDNDLNNEK